MSAMCQDKERQQTGEQRFQAGVFNSGTFLSYSLAVENFPRPSFNSIYGLLLYSQGIMLSYEKIWQVNKPLTS